LRRLRRHNRKHAYTPYLRRSVRPEIVAALAVIAAAVKIESRLPTGIQIVPGANIAMMSVAHAPGLDFICAEAYIQSATLQRTLSKLPILHDLAQRAAGARAPTYNCG